MLQAEPYRRRRILDGLTFLLLFLLILLREFLDLKLPFLLLSLHVLNELLWASLHQMLLLCKY
jgi:hypothetical protein